MRLAVAVLAYSLVLVAGWRALCGPKETAGERALRRVNDSLDEDWRVAVPRIGERQTQYGRITKHS